MKHWRLLIGGLVVVAATVSAQQPATNGWVQPKTPWGDPDMQGVWRYEAAVPLERPARFAGRASLTDEEVAERQKVEDEQEGQRLSGAEGTAVGRGNLEQSPIRGNEYNSFWQDHGRPRKVLRQTSMIVDPKDGQLPFTPDARKASARATARNACATFASSVNSSDEPAYSIAAVAAVSAGNCSGERRASRVCQ